MNQGCEIVASITGAGTATVTIGLQMYWSNPNGYYVQDDDQKCRLGGSWSPNVSTTPWTEITGNPAVSTDGAIVDSDGRVVRARAPGSRVPER